MLVGEECGVVTHSRGVGCQFHEFKTLLFLARLCFCYRWTSNKNIDVAAVHLLKGKQVDLQLPGVMYMYLDCHTSLALQVCDLYNHVRIEIHLCLYALRAYCHHIHLGTTTPVSW